VSPQGAGWRSLSRRRASRSSSSGNDGIHRDAQLRPADGMIRFGSRVDTYLPPGSRVLVDVGQRMVGAETVLAECGCSCSRAAYVACSRLRHGHGTPHVGGAFGGKAGVIAEHTAVIGAARALRRPLVWVESRSENLVSMHGRGQIAYYELGLTRTGIITGLRARVLADAGAYAGLNGALVMTTTGRVGEPQWLESTHERQTVYCPRRHRRPVHRARHAEACTDWFDGPGSAGTEGMMASLDMPPPRRNALAAGVTEDGRWGDAGAWVSDPVGQCKFDRHHDHRDPQG